MDPELQQRATKATTPIAGAPETLDWCQPSPASAADVATLHAAQLAQWRTHPQYQRCGAEHFVESVHGPVRQKFADLVAKSNAAKKVDLRAFRTLMKALEIHHKIEDATFFPLMSKSAPWTAEHFKHLEGDHQHLHPLERQVAETALPERLADFVNFLNFHLQREEMVVVPLMLDGFFTRPPIQWWLVASILTLAAAIAYGAWSAWSLPN